MPRPAPTSKQSTVLEDLPFCLARVSLVFRRFNEQTLRRHGLSALAPGMASVLHAAAERPAATVADLAAQTQFPKGTLTGLLDELESMGLINRRRNPDDGRSWQIYLTVQGRLRCTRLAERHRQAQVLLRAALGPRDERHLRRLLQRVTQAMQNAIDPQSQASVAVENPPTRPRRRRLLSRPNPRRSSV